MPEMSSSSDFPAETNFMAQYMANVSRAGVFLNTAFPSFKPSSGLLPLSPHFVSSSTLPSEDSLQDDCTILENQDDVCNTEEHLLTNEYSIGDWEGNQIRAMIMANPAKEDVNDPLLKKLEQLKELQKQKQEQLKQQQMEQLQKLMEEQKMLISMASKQSILLDVGITEDHPPRSNGGSASHRENNNHNNPVNYLCGQDIFLNGPNKNVGNYELESEDNYTEFNDESLCNGSQYSSSQCDHSESSIQDTDQTLHQVQEENSGEDLYTEERPIVSGIKERMKSFEEFLEEQMRLEEERLLQTNQHKAAEDQVRNTTTEKRPFLKRGEGLARFSNANKNATKIKESKSVLPVEQSVTTGSVRVDKQTLQRKVAPITKDQIARNVPFVDKKLYFSGMVKPEPAVRKVPLKNVNFKNNTPSQVTNKCNEDTKSAIEQEQNAILENKENIHNAMLVDANSRGTSIQKNVMMDPKYAPPENDFDFSFDISFKKRRVIWDKEKQKENFELDEFLLLEQAAEEISFSNNSSFVQKLLTQDYQVDGAHRRLSSTPVKSIQVQPVNAVCIPKDATAGRRKDAGAILKGISGVASSGNVNQNEIEAKLAVREEKTIKVVGLVREEDLASSEDDHESSVASEIHLENDRTGREDDPFSEKYKGPCKNMSKTTKARDIDLDLSDGEDNNDESTLLEGKSEEALFLGNDSNPQSPNTSQIDYDDEKTWADLEDVGSQLHLPEGNVIKRFSPSIYISKDPEPIVDNTVKRKIASKKEDDVKVNVPVNNSDPPPTSDLMMKLFPSLRSKPKNESQLASKSGPDKVEADTAQSRLLKEKLVQLETEIERFKVENATLVKRREEQEKTMETLRKDVAAFEKQKEVEMAKFEEFKKEEMKKLQKERKVFEKYASAARAAPDKREREEIQSPLNTARKTQNSSYFQTEKATVPRRSQSPPKGKNSKKTPSSNAGKVETSKAEPPGIILLQELKDQIPSNVGSKDDVQGEIVYSDGKVERILRDGTHVIVFPNGTRKDVSADGKTTTVTFFNGDVKQVMEDQRIIYYYADAQTTHTTYPDGLEILQFSNGQIEKHFPDGKKEITFPDQTIKNLYMDGREESIFPDGTIITVHLDGSKVIEFDNGQRELHTAHYKRRQYPDGTVKTVYSNGQIETKYASGRVRIKDKDGNVIMDTKIDP
ncbi:hypothetical protein GDO86_004646 [Hymenochirus boettgeri]|uniref:Centrosomal P4.1-associated protein n=1 Tax=Hymenochirus boettgeri TaxID=247094 RepID=A0A8T2KAL3_9PIPI|nr:hypothetical protein GDO86_004646 [Hymenochirus boettgeri]